MSGALYRLGALREGYKKRRISPVEIVQEALDRIDAYADPAVWIARAAPEKVLARARELEAARNAFDDLPLYGVPFAVKDNIDAAGFPTTAGCPAFAYAPRSDAHVVSRLLAAGAILMGKTNLDQFATGLVGTRSPYGAPRCVFNTRYVSGGSSSGSAVAVAVGLVAFALGTDTAGSGRVPAAYNNIVGLKPTRGLISTRGVVPACRSLDCVSVFAQDVEDAGEVFRTAQAFDAADPYSRTSPPMQLPGYDRLRVGILKPQDRDFFGDGDSARLYESAISRLASLGAKPVFIDFAPFREAGALLYDGAWAAERLVSLKAFMAKHEDAMDSTVRAIIASARTLSAVDAFESQYRLATLRRAAEAQWANMDVLLVPTVAVHDTVEQVEADPIARNTQLGRYTNFVNLLDYCAIAVPAGFRDNGLPFGVTFIADAFADGALAGVAGQFLRARDSKTRAKRSTDVRAPFAPSPEDASVALFVVGAHLSGMPLNHELGNLGANFERAARTATHYRLFVLPQTVPAKPGLVCSPGLSGPGIAGEIWLLSQRAFGRLVAAVPAPLSIGKIALEDGSRVSGFLCEAFAAEGATEITQFGGWRSYVESLG